MSERNLYLDKGWGETRGVVLVDGRPERLILRRDGDDARLALGARLIARVANLEPALATAFLDLGQGAEAILPYKSGSTPPVRGSAIEVEIRGEARRGKLPIARYIGEGEGAPRLQSPALAVEDELALLVPGAKLVRGASARRVADEAQSEVLDVLHAMPGGGTLAIEPTRALTAIDVDLGERKGVEAKRVTRQANLVALGMSARLLRLKGLGGIVVIDLVGRGHDGVALMAAARAAFSPDNPGVSIGPVGRFGTMELSLPRRVTPLGERLCDPDGRVSARTLAHELLRRIEDEATSEPGSRILASCSPEVASEAARFSPALANTVGARFEIRPDAGWPRDRIDVGRA